MKLNILLVLIGISFSGVSIANTYQVKVSAIGMVPKKNNDENSIVFRHIDHDTEGWADIVIAKVKNNKLVNSEATYRDAALDSGFDTYYSKPTSYRCTGQIYGPSVVPAIDYGCDTGTLNLQKYILYKKPDYISNMPEHIVKVHDQNYGQRSTMSWIQTHGISGINLEVGITSLLSAKSRGSSMGYYPSLVPGDWIMTSDPKTNKR